MKNLIQAMKQRTQSDEGASYTIEIIFGIVLSVFAGLALYTYILKPVQSTADSTGEGIKTFTGGLMNSQGKGTTNFTPGAGTGE